MSRNLDLTLAPLEEGALILVLAALGWLARWPFVFASLGPTAYSMIEQPELKSARPYNVVVGHLVGLGAGWLGLWIFHARASPNVMAAGFVPAPRLWAAVAAAIVTTLVTLALRASQPASLATTLLVALGAMQTGRDAVAIAVSVLILAAIGQPLRLRRIKAARRHQLAKQGAITPRPI